MGRSCQIIDRSSHLDKVGTEQGGFRTGRMEGTHGRIAVGSGNATGGVGGLVNRRCANVYVAFRARDPLRKNDDRWPRRGEG